MARVPVLSTLARATPRKRLWLGGSAVAVFLVTAVVCNGLIPRDRAVGQADLGHDFLAFYTAATFVRDGRARDLYNLDAVRGAEQATARANGVDSGTAFGPWWNPPFYALALEPLARLPYGRALDAWRWLNLGALVGAVVLLGGMVTAASKGDPSDPIPFDRALKPLDTNAPAAWPRVRIKAGRLATVCLVGLLVGSSMPFIQAISHGQNTFTSLLLLTATVALWRAGRAVWAGVVGGLLFYKPQLGAVVAGVMALDLGWAAVAGLATTGAGLLAVTTVALPGSLADWLRDLPANVHFMQVEHAYLWDRHVTIKAFWRLLLQGTAAGEPTRPTAVLTDVSVTAVAGALAWAALRARGRADRRDRLIGATICAMPLLMPFYFDYDLLLLAVPATLYAIDRDRRSSLTAGWVLLSAWLFVNATVASRLHVGGAAVLLAGLSGASIWRVIRPGRDAPAVRLPAPHPRAVAA